MATTISVLLVEHQPMLAEALELLLVSEPGIEAVGVVANAGEALGVCHRRAPDVVLLDIDLPGPDGIEAARQVRGICPDSQVVVVTALDRAEVMAQALEAGATGFIAKTQSAAELMVVIRAAAAGEIVVAPGGAAPVLRRLHGVRRPGTIGPAPELTPREVDILQALAEGQSTPEVAAALFISPRTVHNHVTAILTKLGVRSKLEAVLLAVHHGVVRLPASAS